MRTLHDHHREHLRALGGGIVIAVVYPSLWETKPEATIESWDELVALLSEHRENADKERQALWSPVTLTLGGTRKNAAVERVNALVIDVDGGTAFEKAKEKLVGREWIAYSTYSHTPEEQRYHVVIRLPEPVKGEEWAKAYDGLKAEIGCGDTLRAPCHSYFVPQHQPGTAFFVEVGGQS